MNLFLILQLNWLNTVQIIWRFKPSNFVQVPVSKKFKFQFQKIQMQWFARWMTQKTINEMDRKNLFEKHFLPIPILFLPVHRMVQNNYTFCHSCVWLNVQQLVRVQEPSRQEVRSAHGGICTQAQAEEKPSHPVISCFTNNRLWLVVIFITFNCTNYLQQWWDWCQC